MHIRDYPPDAPGVLCQGDIVIMRLTGMMIDRRHPIPLRDGRIVVSEGERPGHFHAIDLMDPAARARREMPMPPIFVEKPADKLTEAPVRNLPAVIPTDNRLPVPVRAASSLEPVKAGVAGFYRDDGVTNELCRRGVLLTDKLCIGYLVVEGGPVVLDHPEHDSVRIPPGRYYVGAQAELSRVSSPTATGNLTAGWELRRVVD